MRSTNLNHVQKNLFQESILLDEEEEQNFDNEVPEADDYTEEGLSNLVGTNVTLQHNGQTVKTNIMKQAIGPDGKHIGKYNQNLILDSRKYEVELPYGLVDEYYHNILSENLLSQVDEEGRQSILIK